MRLFLVVVLVAVWPAQLASSAGASDVTMYECVAQKRLAGRHEPDPQAEQAQLPDGTPRYLEEGDPGYAGVEQGKPLPEWLELFGAIAGHGSSFLGFYLSKDFKCSAVNG